MGAPAIDLATIEATRNRTFSAVQSLFDQAAACELPEPPAPLRNLQQRLVENQYSVLVAGEAKRGKSTFINALIGRTILPTDVDIATSQVFRVCNGDHEAYRLRFEDGRELAISAADLIRYGSQAADPGEVSATPDRVIRWIEVDVPVKFIPSGISILDTPGLGSLYAAHAQVTHRFVPYADAVIFVLDSGQPIVHEELEFLETLLGVTYSILFVQTKIDQHRRAEWQEIQRRNQEILAQRFGARLPDARVWPISSTHLLKAGRTGDDDYLLISHHQELAAALQRFLFRTAGWARAADATAMARQHHAAAQHELTRHLAALTQTSRQTLAGTQRSIAERQQLFITEWGEYGRDRRDLVEGIQRIIELGKREFAQALQPGGEIALAQDQKINSVGSLDEANGVGKAMFGEVATAAADKWRRVCLSTELQCGELIHPFIEAVEQLGVSDGASVQPAEPDSNPDNWGFKTSYWDVFKASYRDAMVISFPVAVVALIAAPLAIPAAVAGLVYSIYSGWRSINSLQLKNAQQELRQQLARTLQQVRQYFFDVELQAGRFGRVDEYFDALQRAMLDQVQLVVKQKSDEARSQIDRIQEESRLTDQQRQDKAAQVQIQVSRWGELGRSLADLASELKALDASVGVS